ncbi:hybrid sensor histidine kinase/response regulator [Cyanosarcina cf. burmensis CCALA 770]|nr:hybrid sensor histidine kinase/response regulator [Cyanosarcina cf. burmensis CCALA 770]
MSNPERQFVTHVNPAPLKILLVGQPSLERRIREMLRAVQTPLQLVWQERVQAALAELKTESASVVLLELDRAGQKLKQLRLAYPHMPIVVLGEDEAENAQTALAQGAQEYLVKAEVEAQGLLRALRYAIERQQWQTQWRQTQSQLKQAEEKLSLYQEIVANSNNAIAIYDSQGNFVEQNTAHRTLLGYEDEELYGQKKDEIFSSKAQVAEISTQLQNGDNYRGEVTLRRRQGWLVTVELFAFPLRDRSGEPVYYVGIGRDVTERLQAESTLKERDRLLAAVATANNHLLTTTDFSAAIDLALETLGQACNVDRVYVFENHLHPSTGELLMSQRFEWTSSTVIAQIDNPELQSLSYQTCSPVWYDNLVAGKPIGGLVKNLPAHEREVLDRQQIISILVVPIFLEGQFWGFVGFDDCHRERQWTETERAILSAAAGSIGGAIARQQTKVALQESELQFRAIFEHSSIGIGLSDLKGGQIDSNPALCHILGYSREELLKMSFTDYTHPDDIAADVKLFYELVMGQRDRYEIEKRYTRKDGCQVWCRLNHSLVRDSANRPQFVIALVEDITIHKQIENHLRDSKEAAEAGSRAKSEFLAIMSHELRTPLNGVLGLSQLLGQELFGSLNAKQKEYVSCIHSSGEHLLALINDVLDLCKVEAGREELTLVRLNVRDLCTYCLSVVRDRAVAKQLQLLSEIDPQIDSCIADERRVKQMLLNLLANAIKFTPKGQVSLRVEQVNQGIAFKVADTGIGIERSQLNLLFQPFKQLDSRLNRQYEGTGLGLSLTRKLARLHGGDVTVRSTVGKGSEFTLWLPNAYLNDLRQEPAKERSLLSPTEPKLSRKRPASGCRSPIAKRILIVEDDDRSALLLQDYFEIVGYQVKHLKHPHNFQGMLYLYQPDLLLLDVQLPGGVSGMDLLCSLRQQPEWQKLPAIILTASVKAGERDRFLAAGANDYFSKPIGIAQIEKILMQYLS